MAEIKYKISGQSDTTAIAKTQLAMKKLGSEVVNLNKMVSGFAIAKVMQVVSKVTNGATENFLAQNKALQQYNATVAKFGKSLSNLNKIQNEVSRNNFFDGDSINNATKMAVAMGLTEKQIEDVLRASTDLAASGVMPLDQAVKALSRSYSGNVEELKRMNPELAKLTKEQLEQGEAVRIIGQEYKGMADAMANTFEGRDTQWKNSFSDLQAAVGGVMQAAKFGFQGKMMDSLNKVTEWITENKESIVKFLYGLPDIISVIGKSAFEIIKRTFSSEGIMNLFSFLGKCLIISFKAALTTVFELVRGLFDDILTLLDFTIGNTWRNLQDLLGNLGNSLIETLNIAFQKVLSIPGIKQIYEWLSGNKVGNVQLIDFRFDTNHADNNLSWKDVTSKFDANFKKLINTYKEEVADGISEESRALKEFISYYSDITSDATEQIKEILSKDLPDDIKQAMVAGIIATGDNKDKDKDNSSQQQQQQQQSVFAKWAIDAKNLFNPIKITERLAAHILGKTIDNKLTILKAADVYDGADYEKEIEILSKFRDMVTQLAKGEYVIKLDNGDLVDGIKISLAKVLDLAIGTKVVDKYNEKHNIDEITILKSFTKFIADRKSDLSNFIKKIDYTIFDKITKFFIKDEVERKRLYDDIKAFTKSTREVIKKISVDLFSTVGNTLAKSSGDIGNYVNAATQGASNGGGFYGALLAIISQLLSDIIKIVSENSEKFQVFQNFITLLLETFVQQIVPIFDEFVTPFFEGFSAVKEILSGVIYLLGSIIGVFTEIFKEFTRELNITASTVSGIFKFIGGIFQIIRGFIQFLQPIMNALSYVTRIIATAIYAVEWVIVNGINMIIRALNQIPWVDIDTISGFGTDDWDKTMSDIWNGGGNTDEDNAYLNNAISQSASNVTGASASYTAARDIYVTINYEHSYVNGDAREIALNLYDELKDCKKLNLIA